MRKVLRAAIILMIGAAAAHADDPAASARRLTEALLHSKVETAPVALSSPSVTPMPSNANDTSAGIVGEVKMSFTGRDANAEIRYAVFANPDDARKYAMNFSSTLTASNQRRLFLPYLSDAECAQRGRTQLCGEVSDNVFVLAISNGVATANSHEGQTKRGVSAGTVEQYGLAHLQNARQAQPAR